MIRVLVADDHGVVRLGVAQLLSTQAQFEVVALAPDGETAVAFAKELAPDVVLMDIMMPGIGGITATRRIMAAQPATRVVAFTAVEDKKHVLDAIDAGAVGYLVKGSPPCELIRGLEAAARGESPLDPLAATALIAARSRRAQATTLSDRERDVLTQLTTGKTNKQIASHLGITENTVRGHLSSIFQRIGVADRTQAALWAQSHGLMEGAGRLSQRSPGTAGAQPGAPIETADNAGWGLRFS